MSPCYVIFSGVFIKASVFVVKNIGFTSCKAKQPRQGIELQGKGDKEQYRIGTGMDQGQSLHRNTGIPIWAFKWNHNSFKKFNKMLIYIPIILFF